jgi:hypothetical protein
VKKKLQQVTTILSFKKSFNCINQQGKEPLKPCFHLTLFFLPAAANRDAASMAAAASLCFHLASFFVM